MLPPSHPGDDNVVVLGPSAGLVEPADLDAPAVLEQLGSPAQLGVFGPGGPARRRSAALLGIAAIGVGVGLILASTLGAGVGLAALLGIAPGWGSAILAAALIASAAAGGHRPGPATLALVLGAAPIVNVTAELLDGAHTAVEQVAMWALGFGLCIAGASLLVAARLGAASLELAMLALAHRRIAGRLPGVVGARYLLEGSFLVAAIALGGDVGVGTVACAVAAGPLLRFAIPAATAAVYGPLVDGEHSTVPAAA